MRNWLKVAVPAVWVAVISLLFVMNAPAQTESRSTEAAVQAALGSATWLELDSIEMSETDEGSPMMSITYLTREMGDNGFRAEMIEIYRLVGSVGWDAENAEVTLVSTIEFEDRQMGLLAVTATVEDVRALATGSMTRTDFLDVLQEAPLEHHFEGQGESA